MRKFLNSLQAVLWALIGLGGRRADADKRVDQGSLPWAIVLAVVIVLLLVGGLIGIAKWAAGQ